MAVQVFHDICSRNMVIWHVCVAEICWSCYSVMAMLHYDLTQRFQWQSWTCLQLVLIKNTIRQQNKQIHNKTVPFYYNRMLSFTINHSSTLLGSKLFSPSFLLSKSISNDGLTWAFGSSAHCIRLYSSVAKKSLLLLHWWLNWQVICYMEQVYGKINLPYHMI